MKKALIVDDHPVLRGGLKALVEKDFPFIAVTEHSGAEGILEEICGTDWAFVILDISLPSANGIDILKKTRACCPEIPIIVFSLYSKSQFAARALRAGAFAYLPKDSELQDLVDVMKRALYRHKMIAAGERPKQPILSDREIQVLTMLGKGMSQKEVATYLKIDGRTVSTYKSRLMQKLDLHTSADLVRYASDENLID
jgi:DNA-binding NarL/FixJ family response regulator